MSLYIGWPGKVAFDKLWKPNKAWEKGHGHLEGGSWKMMGEQVKRLCGRIAEGDKERKIVARDEVKL